MRRVFLPRWHRRRGGCGMLASEMSIFAWHVYTFKPCMLTFLRAHVMCVRSVCKRLAQAWARRAAAGEEAIAGRAALAKGQKGTVRIAARCTTRSLFWDSGGPWITLPVVYPYRGKHPSCTHTLGRQAIWEKFKVPRKSHHAPLQRVWYLPAELPRPPLTVHTARPRTVEHATRGVGPLPHSPQVISRNCCRKYQP